MRDEEERLGIRQPGDRAGHPCSQKEEHLIEQGEGKRDWGKPAWNRQSSAKEEACTHRGCRFKSLMHRLAGQWLSGVGGGGLVRHAAEQGRGHLIDSS